MRLPRSAFGSTLKRSFKIHRHPVLRQHDLRVDREGAQHRPVTSMQLRILGQGKDERYRSKRLSHLVTGWIQRGRPPIDGEESRRARDRSAVPDRLPRVRRRLGQQIRLRSVELPSL